MQKKNGSKEIIILYCVSNYPSKIEDFNLKNISILKKKFKKIVGFSDHSVDDFVSFIAINEGAEIIEKHIAFDKNSIDAEFSKKTNELKSYISNLKRIRLLKKKNKYVLPKLNSGKKFQRSIFVTENLNVGEKLSHKNIKAIRPNNGIDASEYYSVIGKKIKRKIKKNNPLLKNYF